MRKITSIIALLAICSAWNAEAQGNTQTAQGYVYEDANHNLRKDRKEKGIPGVMVSDGCQIVETDANGHWQMEVDDHCVIFVIKPKGWISPVNEFNQPMCWYTHKVNGSPEGMKWKGSDPTGPLPKSIDFAMTRNDESSDFSFFAFGDPQPYSKEEVDFFHKGIVNEARNVKGPIFGISLGDICGERADLYPFYLEAIKDMGLPWYNVIGNHDRNYDAGSDALSNEAFEATFGPSTYAFQYGDTYFIDIDDIYYEGKNPLKYYGGFSERQFKFLENFLTHISKDDLVIVSYHIPINYKPGQFLDSHRRRFFKIFEGQKVMGLSAHTHIQMQFYCGKEVGWNGEEPYYEYNVATSNGDWYSGELQSDGTPAAMMRDGTPKGYAIVHVKDGKVTYDYKVANHPWEYQMNIWGAKVIPYRQGGKFPLYVNFFVGGDKDIVQYRIDGCEWRKMAKVNDEADPFFLEECYKWDTDAMGRKGHRPGKAASMCTHLWKTTLDNKLEPGEHVVDVKVTDQFGKVFTDKFTYRTENR